MPWINIGSEQADIPKRKTRFVWEGVVLAGQTSDPIYLPNTEHSRTIIALYPGIGGGGSFEMTISSPERIEGNTAVWYDSGLGIVTSKTMKSFVEQVHAVRFIADTADLYFEISV